MYRAGTTDPRLSYRFWLCLAAIAATRVSAPVALAAQERPVAWKLSAPTPVRGALTAKLDATIADGWYLYSQTEPPGGPVPTSIVVIGGGYKLLAVPRAPEPERRPDGNFNIVSEVYTDSVRFMLALERPRATQDTLQLAIRFQTCTIHFCLPPRTDTVIATARAARVAALPPATGPSSGSATSPDAPATMGTRAALRVVQQPAPSGLAAFLWLACVTAFFALLTPCVFPMIPVTVGYFTGRSEGGRTGGLRDALLFAAGIIGSFALLGLTVSALFGAGNIVRLAANPWLNLIIAALFLLFALQLAGWIAVPMPAALATRLTIATAGRRDAGATLLMGAVFSLTSFTCTAPFIGSLLVFSSRGDRGWPLLGLVTYAAVFALPFFALALFPSALTRLPRSGPWLGALKGVVAFLELAAVVKFVSNADLVWGWGVFTRSTVLIVWLVIALALIVWLVRSVVVPGSDASTALRAGRLVVAAAALLAATRLWSGLSGSGLGEIESYLPPPRADALLLVGGTNELPWRLDDFDGARAIARRTGRPILVDFTGYTCTNCRWMEANMFTRPAVRRALTRYERVRLYTDGTGTRDVDQQVMEQRLFGTVALPLYAIFGPDGTARDITFIGMSRDETRFLEFLNSEGLSTARIALAPTLQ